MEYEFTFVVDGATVDDAAAVNRLADELDAMLARAGGQNLLSVSSVGDNAVEAALSVAHIARELVPGLRLLRLDRDLVGVQEIAERTGRSRQNVHQWATGARLADKEPFPRPEGTVGRAHAWLWSEVNDWLRRHGLDDGVLYPTRHEMTQIDYLLANGLSFSFRSTPAQGFTESRREVVAALMAHLADFSQFVARRLPREKTAADQHILAIAGHDEPAHEVMRFIAEANRDVVLVSARDDVITGVHFSVDMKGPQEVVYVRHDFTVWDWMDQVRDKPSATFVAEDPALLAAPHFHHRQTLSFNTAAA
ncbi:helix-turn-helix transcriptional regulator [Streptomyces eurocidicus]|uniref:Putative DNA-binding transcriptional regulator AlpA n=1 Tax=Streptomyces eurocidicus TaxID=66423 RepID=A0A7W8BA59_STREU|nr:hypothetical protein [Streptomyces eurocidicus]MBB5119604.1 putative DNA-binding transcriptional regulator AlpA [Streptomyces eurocidicus]MBF6050639.1 hypothetical protein [Streptomyces eurocidicus]